MKHTKKQIQESIKHWQKVLESMGDISEVEDAESVFNIEFAWTGYQNGDTLSFIATHDMVSAAMQHEFDLIEEAYADDEDTDWNRVSNDLNALITEMMSKIDSIDEDNEFTKNIDFGNETILMVTVKLVTGASFVYFCK